MDGKENQKGTLAQYCEGFIKKYIYTHGLQPGDKLPSSKKLCGFMGVSLSPLREALKILESKGEIAVVNGKGILVGSGREEKTPDIASIFFGTQKEFSNIKKQLLELLEVRKVLEAQMIENVVRSASDEELSEVEGIVKRLMQMQRLSIERKDASLTTPEDKRFHSALSSLSHNTVLENILEMVNGMFHKMWEDEGKRMDFLYEGTIDLHEKMFEKILKRDLRGAQIMNGQTIDLIFSRIIYL